MPRGAPHGARRPAGAPALPSGGGALQRATRPRAPAGALALTLTRTLTLTLTLPLALALTLTPTLTLTLTLPLALALTLTLTLTLTLAQSDPSPRLSPSPTPNQALAQLQVLSTSHPTLTDGRGAPPGASDAATRTALLQLISVAAPAALASLSSHAQPEASWLR